MPAPHIGVCVFTFVLLGCSHVVEASLGTPIEQVLEMMNDLMLKSMQEKKAEKETFEKFTKWCHETTRDKGFDIEDGAKNVDSLSTDLEKHTSDAAALQLEVADLDTEIDEGSEQLRKATNKRNYNREEYEKTHEEYATGLLSLGSAIKKVETMIAATEGAQKAVSASMLEESAGETHEASKAARATVVSLIQTLGTQRELPGFAQRALASFLEDGDDVDAAQFGTPEAAGFESQSHTRLKNLQKMHEMLKEEKLALEKSELESQNAFNLIRNDLENQIKNNKASRATKFSSQKESEGSAAKSRADLEETKRAKAADEKYTRDLAAMCKEKTADFEARQKTRAEEIEAIDNAMEIISSGDVAGAGSKHLPGLMQKKATAFSQLRSSTLRQAPKPQTFVAAYLATQAGKLGSKQLALLASHAGADPFVKVRDMIKAMIDKLQEEASEEADHKKWCDEELSTNEQTRTSKSTRIAELKASIEEMEAEAQKAAEESANLVKSVAELDAAVAEANANRDSEKARNTETIADAKTAIGAVQRAVKVLKDFYKKAAGATSLLQSSARAAGPTDDAPGTFDAPYTGNSGNNGAGGIVSMMDIILSDFQRLFADTEEAEAMGKAEFKKFMTESTANRESKEEERVAKNSLVSKTKHNIRMASKDLKSTQDELDAAMNYYDELKPSCVEDGINYDDRVKAREEEIASLQEALKLLLEGTPEEE